MDSSELNYCVILAGGIGSRLWPVSRASKPKQFLDLFGTGRTLLQQTYDRFAKIVLPDHIYISTNRQYVDLVMEQLPQVTRDRILAEPIRRNTLPSVAWATSLIAHRCPEANIVVTPADQLILQEDAFREDILRGLYFVRKTDGLLTMGIKPTRPDTGYGYIQVGEEMIDETFSKVKSFTEKPELDFARMFMESGEFYWNTGLFLWNAAVMLKAVQKQEPDYAGEFAELMEKDHEGVADYVPEYFSALPNLSLDYGILERSENVYVQICHFGWADLGNWWSLHDDAACDAEGNVLLDTQALLSHCKGNVIRLPKGRVAVLNGLEGFVVAEEGNVLMICPKTDVAAFRRMMTEVQMKLGETLN